MSILFVNACLRGSESRTLELCNYYLDKRKAAGEIVDEVNLESLHLQPFYAEEVERRSQLERDNDFSDPVFDLAKQFAAADEIVIGAPYWDLSFPAALKVYIEWVSVCDITFHYTEAGTCEGMSKAPHITYIATCGGSVEGADYGHEYICGIARMFGIPEVRYVAAQLMDVVGMDVDAIMADARAQIDLLD